MTDGSLDVSRLSSKHKLLKYRGEHRLDVLQKKAVNLGASIFIGCKRNYLAGGAGQLVAAVQPFPHFQPEPGEQALQQEGFDILH